MTRQSYRRRLAGALLLGCSLVPVAEAGLNTATPGRVCGLAVVYQLAYQRDLLLAEMRLGRLPYPHVSPGVAFYSGGGGLGLPCPGRKPVAGNVTGQRGGRRD